MIQDLLKEHDNSRLSIRELQARIESTEPANKIVNDLILNILGSGKGLEQEKDEEELDTKETLT